MLCDFCSREHRPTFLLSEVGEHQPELWACVACLRGAEDGSLLAEWRALLYAEDVALAAGMYP